MSTKWMVWNVVLVKIVKRKQIIYFRIVRKTLQHTWDFLNVPLSQILHKYQNHRAGVHGLRLSIFSGRTCAKHRQEYGIQWKRKRRTCCHSLHKQSQSGIIASGITFIQSREIWMKLSTHFPTGSGKKKLPLPNDIILNKPKIFI